MIRDLAQFRNRDQIPNEVDTAKVAEKMRAVRPGIKVLFMSGYARPVLASQGRLDPDVALVEKPFSEADLLDMTAQILNGRLQELTATAGRAAQ